MKGKNKKVYILLSAVACLCAGVVGGLSLSRLDAPVQAQTTYNADTFAMVEGASVRKDARHGIRFATAIGTDKLTEWKTADSAFALGTIILPENVLHAANKDLTVDFKYEANGETYLPSIAYYSHTQSVLTEDPDFPNCKLFNAVLELSTITQSHPDFLTQNLVARSFITLNGKTTYVDETVVRSAAYVGAAALDDGETDDYGVLDSYVRHLESVSLGEAKQINVAVGESKNWTATVSPANVYPVNYTAGDGATLENGVFTATAAGKTTLTASVAGGKKTDTVEICAIEAQTIERKYYAEADAYEYETVHQYNASGKKIDTPTEALAHRNDGAAMTSFYAYNVDDVYYNGEKLRLVRDYIKSAESGYMQISVKTALLAESGRKANVLRLASAQSGDVEVDITTYYEGEDALTEELKDYLNSDLQYNPYAYYSVRDAEMTVATPTNGYLIPGTSTLATTARENMNFYTEGYIGDYYDAGLDWALGQSSAGISGFLSQLATSNESYDATDTFEAYRPTEENPTVYKEKLQARAADLYNTLEIAQSLGKTNSVIITDGVLNDTDRMTIENCYAGKTSHDYTLENWTTAPTFINANVSGSVFTTRQMKSFDHLVAFYTPYVLRYALHPAFGGLMLRDEPNALYMNLVGETYKAVKKIYENIESGFYTYLNPNDSAQTIQTVALPKGSYEHFKAADKQIIVNLLPFYGNSTDAFPYVEGMTTSGNDTAQYTAYKHYLECWFLSSGADYVQMDIYSLYQQGIYRYHNVNVQMAAEVAKKYDAKIAVINSAWRRHSHETVSIGSYVYSTEFKGERLHTYEDMAWMNNLTMMYGASNFGYYTYHTLSDSTGQIVEDGASMVNRDGQKTTIYDYVREINRKAQILAPVILNFDYVQSKYVNTVSTSNTHQSKLTAYASASDSISDSMNTCAKLTNATSSDATHSFLINELCDSKKGNYMYAVMNILDTIDRSTEKKTVELTFAKGITHAWVYFDGQFSVMQVQNGKLSLSMQNGEAYYVIPYDGSHNYDYLTKPNEGWENLWG